MRHAIGLLVLCLWMVLSQHRGSDSQLWWRPETKPVSLEECFGHLKAVSGRPAVGATKWYDVRMAQLHQHFGTVDTPTISSWFACWPEDVWRTSGTTIWGEPDR